MTGRVAVVDAVRVHWSEAILDEVRRNLALRPDLNLAAIDYRIDRMNVALPDARQGPAPDELIESLPINAKDRHVLALAAHMEADSVVTSISATSRPLCASCVASTTPPRRVARRAGRHGARSSDRCGP